MKSQFFVLLVLIAVALSPAVAAAQTDQTTTISMTNQTNNTTQTMAPTTTETPTPTPTESEQTDSGSEVSVPVDVDAQNGSEAKCTEHIDASLALCSASLNGDTVILQFESSTPQRIVLTEAMTRTGELSRERVFVNEGRNTVRFELTQSGGGSKVGVTIDTGATMYGKVIEDNPPLIGGPWSASDAQAAGVGGALSVSLSTLVIVLRKLRGDDTSTERVA